MSRTLFLLGISVCTMLVMVSSSNAEEANNTVWLNNYEDALKLAKKTNKPLLIHVYSQWCIPCQRMENDVLYTDAVRKELKDKVIAVKVDGQDRRDLVKKLKVQFFPADVFVDPQGRVLHNVTGYKEITDYAKLIAMVESNYTRSQMIRNTRNQPVVSNMKKHKAKKVSFKPTIALEGYSPVALRLDRKWIAGKSEITSEYKGLKFQFSTEDEKKEFEENPSKFAPRLLGCDPVTMWESDRAILGKTEYGAFFDGELFLFTSAENRQLFKIDPIRYTQTRHVLNMDDVNSGTILK